MTLPPDKHAALRASRMERATSYRDDYDLAYGTIWPEEQPDLTAEEAEPIGRRKGISPGEATAIFLAATVICCGIVMIASLIFHGVAL